MADLGILTRQCPMFEIGHRGEGIDGADTIECEREIVRIQPSGCYDPDEAWAVLGSRLLLGLECPALPSGQLSRDPTAPNLRNAHGLRISLGCF
jgi:hypothetical protein